MFENKKCLNGEWKLYIEENCKCSSFANELCDESAVLSHGISSISGSVPGNFELDMQRAGLIGDPFFGTNPIEMQRLENRHLWYCREFEYDKDSAKNAILIFEGIDTIADIYLNGKKIGSSDNMLIAHEFNATGIKKGKNELMVHIIPTCIAARDFDFDMDVTTHLNVNASSLQIRKAAHSFGWDILPRIISGGIWRDVFIAERKTDYIKDIFLHTTNITPETAKITGHFDVELSGDFCVDYSLKIHGICKESSFDVEYKKLWHDQGNLNFNIDNPLLWWPRDMGEQNLYRVTAELYYNGNIVDTYEFSFGIRTITHEMTDTTDADGNGEFLFRVNNEPFFVRGTNWVPLDALHSRDNERMPKALAMLKDINCNMVRCWGGNVYEDHAFFDFCDENGILVWQDFAMGCATYPQDDSFAARFKAEIEFIVKKLRQHPSIALWAGDNECDIAAVEWKNASRNPNKNRLTRQLIPEVLNRLDPFRAYLPSSPYMSEQAYKTGLPTPENHLWGPRDYYKGEFYSQAVAHFASETGYHACPSPASLPKFLSPDCVWPEDNDEWHVHQTCMELERNCEYSFRNKLMFDQVKVLFGKTPENLQDFALASQISQGEAVKYFIERFRITKWRRTGIIWWNLLDGWPQFSDAVVDYYFTKKAAYSFIKRSQEPVCLMMREPENGIMTLVGANEFLTEKAVKYTLTDITSGKKVCDGEITLPANQATDIISVSTESDVVRFYLIEWQYDGKTYKNHYISGKVPYSFEEVVDCFKKCNLLKLEGFED